MGMLPSTEVHAGDEEFGMFCDLHVIVCVATLNMELIWSEGGILIITRTCQKQQLSGMST